MPFSDIDASLREAGFDPTQIETEVGTLVAEARAKAVMLPVTAAVMELEQRSAEAEELLGSIIATLNLEGNVEWFADMPEDWHSHVSHWTERWHQLTFVV